MMLHLAIVLFEKKYKVLNKTVNKMKQQVTRSIETLALICAYFKSF